MSGFHHHGDRPRWQMLVPIVGYGVLLLLSWIYREWLAGISTSYMYGVHPVALLVLVSGFPIFREAIKGLLQFRVSADLAVAIAAIAALVIGENFAAAEVILIMLVGGALEELAVDRTERSIKRIIELAPEVARVRRADTEAEIPVGQVEIGDTVIIRPGERVGVDGEVISGRSAVNEATITGEPLPTTKAPGDEVHAGTLNDSGALEVRATRVGENTTIARIAQLVQDAREQKGAVQHRADRWATWFVPIVFIAAAATYIITKEPIRAVAVLVVACPCALVLATPTAIVAAIGRLARDGVLVRGGAHVEALASADVVAFDKTGTITRGRPRVVAVEAVGEATVADVIRHAASIEEQSEHALGRLIVARAEAENVETTPAAEFTVHPGAGVSGTVSGKRVAVGKLALLDELGFEGIAEAREAAEEYLHRGAMLAFCAVAERVTGFVAAEDPPRDEAREAIHDLDQAGIEGTLLITGDHDRAARTIREATGIAAHRADLLPQDKADIVAAAQAEGKTVVAVGDGVNDAPALATASVGIAMGDVATDITADAADVILTTADLRRIPALIQFSRRTMSTITTNVIWFALLFNGIGVFLSARGTLGPMGAAVYHQIASLLVVLNSLRLLAAGKLEERGRVARVTERLGGITHGFQHWLDDIQWGRIWEIARKRRAWLLSRGSIALIACYVLSGVYTVGPDEIAIVRRLGATLGESRQPGLHYRIPWPVDRVTKLKPALTRVVTVGFRPLPGGEVAGGYEWENAHESGAYERIADESLRITGDENLLDVNVSLQYRVSDARAYLFHIRDEALLAQAVAEQAARRVIATKTADELLTVQRRLIEDEIASEAQALFTEYESGLAVQEARLLDVHPPIQVVPAFREVASAMEEKRTSINQAEAYQKEQLPRARGRASAMKLRADATARTRKDRAAGDAARFSLVERAHRASPQATEIRMHLDAVEKALTGKRKLIIGGGQGRRQMWLIDSDGLRMKGGAPPIPEPTYPVFSDDEIEQEPPPTAPPAGQEDSNQPSTETAEDAAQ